MDEQDAVAIALFTMFHPSMPYFPRIQLEVSLHPEWTKWRPTASMAIRFIEVLRRRALGDPNTKLHDEQIEAALVDSLKSTNSQRVFLKRWEIAGSILNVMRNMLEMKLSDSRLPSMIMDRRYHEYPMELLAAAAEGVAETKERNATLAALKRCFDICQALATERLPARNGTNDIIPFGAVGAQHCAERIAALIRSEETMEDALA